MVLDPAKEAVAARGLREMGPRLRHRRRDHRRGPVRRDPRRRGEGRTSRSPPCRARRRNTTGPGSRRPAPAALEDAPRIDPIEGLQGADLPSRPCLEALDMGAVRHPGHGRHGAAAGPRRGDRARTRDAQGTGLHLRRDAPLRRRGPRGGRQAGGGRGLPQSRRRRGARPSPRPTTSISAIPRSRGSWASSWVRSKGSAPPAGRSTCRSCRATSRSTTRPTGRASCRRRRSARWA